MTASRTWTARPGEEEADFFRRLKILTQSFFSRPFLWTLFLPLISISISILVTKLYGYGYRALEAEARRCSLYLRSIPEHCHFLAEFQVQCSRSRSVEFLARAEQRWRESRFAAP